MSLLTISQTTKPILKLWQLSLTILIVFKNNSDLLGRKQNRMVPFFVPWKLQYILTIWVINEKKKKKKKPSDGKKKALFDKTKAMKKSIAS